MGWGLITRRKLRIDMACDVNPGSAGKHPAIRKSKMSIWTPRASEIWEIYSGTFSTHDDIPLGYDGQPSKVYMVGQAWPIHSNA